MIDEETSLESICIRGKAESFVKIQSRIDGKKCNNTVQASESFGLRKRGALGTFRHLFRQCRLPGERICTLLDLLKPHLCCNRQIRGKKNNRRKRSNVKATKEFIVSVVIEGNAGKREWLSGLLELSL